VQHKEYGQANGVTNATASRTTYDVYDTFNDGHGGRLPSEYRYTGDVNPTGTSPTGWAEKTVYTYDDARDASQGHLGLGDVLEVDDYTSANPSTPYTFTRYAYDPVTGKQASVTTPEGTVNYRYDPATGELLETWTGTAGPSSAGTDVLYGYDDQGRLASVTQERLDGAAVAAGAVTVRYGADGNAISTTQPTTLYAYDAVGNLQSTVEPDGQTTTYQYDDLNRLTLERVTQGSTLVETFDYDQVLATGTKNPDLMLQSDGDRGGEVDTRYNASGGVVSQTTTAWTYDPDDRLTGETLTVQVGAGLASVPAAYTDAFHYDLANNRTEEDIDGGDTTAGGQSIRYVYDADDQLRTETETAYATATTTTQVYQTTYTYDYAGNLWTQTRTGTEAASDTYNYDLRDRMTKAVEAGTETDYGYDTNGVRVSEGSPGTAQTYYVNDPSNPTAYTKAIEEKTGTTPSTATTSRSYVLGSKVEAQSDATNGTLYLLTDGHGSTRALVNASGVTVETYAYDAFGTLLAGTHTSPQTNVTTAVTAATAATEWLFGGDGLYDPASGWTYHLARWTGGFWFTQADTTSGSTYDPISLHKYLYAGSNPVSADDPSGHDFVEVLSTIGISTVLSGLGFGAIAPAGQRASFAIRGATSGFLASSALVYAFSIGAAADPSLPAKVLLGGISSGLLNLLGDGFKTLGTGHSAQWQNYALDFAEGFAWGTASTAFGSYASAVPGLKGWFGDDNVGTMFTRGFTIAFSKSVIDSLTKGVVNYETGTNVVDFWSHSAAAAVADGFRGGFNTLYTAGLGQNISEGLEVIASRLGKDTVLVESILKFVLSALGSGVSSVLSQIRDILAPR
jgi:YD repeat-containing protein